MIHSTLKSWAEDDRPREKMLFKGERALSNAELIAILIGSGSAKETAVELSKRILMACENDLSKLGRMTILDLERFKGIGQAKAIIIKAALELGKRRQHTGTEKKKSVKSSKDAYQLIAPMLQDKRIEEFWIMLFNRRNVLIDMQLVSIGGVSSTVVDAKIVFKKALDHLASGIILVHNHPSGNKSPGQSDIVLTKKLNDAASYLDIDLLDHLILTDHDYFSFRDEGML